jgi:hypothetical protein
MLSDHQNARCEVVPTIWQITGPLEAKRRGESVAAEMMENDRDCVCHSISGGM